MPVVRTRPYRPVTIGSTTIGNVFWADETPTVVVQSDAGLSGAVAIDGQAVGFLQASSVTTDTGAPGFGAVVAIASAILAIAVARRRRT